MNKNKITVEFVMILLTLKITFIGLSNKQQGNEVLLCLAVLSLALENGLLIGWVIIFQTGLTLRNPL